MLDAVIQGLSLAFSFPALWFLFLGIFIGLWIGVIPGLGGAVALALMLPFTFSMDMISAFSFLLGMYAITSTADSIPAILFGIPGTVASQATILDGHPLAKNGEASRAFGAAYAVSGIGGVLGAIFLALSLPIIQPFILAFGVPEFFLLSVLGLTMVGILSGKSLAKGIAMACFGLLLTTIGYSNATGIPRFYFGVNYLLDGIPIIPVMLGLFAIPELMELATSNTSISKKSYEKGNDSLLNGLKDVVQHRWLVFRSALIGTYVGMLPGLGAAIVDWIAYGHAVQSAKDKTMFGRGDIRGVIAPECANNAHKSGALIPTVAFGIPGSVGTAILLGALIMKGLRPGPDMLTTQLPATFSMIWSIVIANVIAAIALFFFSKKIQKIAYLPGHTVVPGVMVVLLMGAWIGTNSMGDLWLCLIMGLIGYLMKQGGWPRPPLILAVVLGPLMEDNFQLTNQIYGPYAWIFERPVSAFIFALIALIIFFSLVKRKPHAAEHPDAGEGNANNLAMSIPFGLLALTLFLVLLPQALSYERFATKAFPVAILIVAIPLTLIAFITEIKVAIETKYDAHNIKNALLDAYFYKSFTFLFYILLTILGVLLLGHVLAISLFVLIYLKVWAKYKTQFSIIYSVIAGLFIYSFYDRVMNVLLINPFG
jgi:TctA family transporter